MNIRIEDPTLADHITRLKARLWDEIKAQGDRLASRWTAVELKGEPTMAEESHGQR